MAARQFTLPMDLLRRQSKSFQIMRDDRFFESTTGMVKAPEISITTFRNFCIWALSSAPQMNPAASLKVVVDLAIFATMYEVVALQNQAVDRIRACLSRGDWQLQPRVVKCIYLRGCRRDKRSSTNGSGRPEHDQPANQPARYVWLQQQAPLRK